MFIACIAQLPMASRMWQKETTCPSPPWSHLPFLCPSASGLTFYPHLPHQLSGMVQSSVGVAAVAAATQTALFICLRTHCLRTSALRAHLTLPRQGALLWTLVPTLLRLYLSSRFRYMYRGPPPFGWRPARCSEMSSAHPFGVPKA